jgi:hypothetical protein
MYVYGWVSIEGKKEKSGWDLATQGIWLGKEKKKKSKIICDEIFEFFY